MDKRLRETRFEKWINGFEKRDSRVLGLPVLMSRCPMKVVVITFYAAQVKSIAAALSAAGVSSVPVHSVDSFQVQPLNPEPRNGSEADMVVCSSVRCNAAGNVGFLSDARRLNVALTRARHALV
ncbi:AAA domain-containing protein [Baffinella frigidus]|nr:AAA domain-containing protein [Cryptophyta sp. CCMP2293]